MKHLILRLVAPALLLLVLNSAQAGTPSPARPASPSEPVPSVTAPTPVRIGTTPLSADELAKYQQKAVAAQTKSGDKAAGAVDTTTLIIIGVVVAVVVIAAASGGGGGGY